MRKKHKRQILMGAVAYLFLVGQMIAPQHALAAASGTYTDLLPIGAAADTTVISRGSGWALTTLAPSQTFGDALSRAPYTAYQSTTAVNVTASTTLSTYTAISGQGKVGSTTFLASWVASGRSFRISARGRLATATAQNNAWQWGLNVGTTTIVTSSASAPSGITSTAAFTVSGVFTIAATGNTGSINGGFDIFATTGTTSAINTANISNVMSYSTYTASAQTVDLTSQLTINPWFKWESAVQGNNITFTNVLVEFLN